MALRIRKTRHGRPTCFHRHPRLSGVASIETEGNMTATRRSFLATMATCAAMLTSGKDTAYATTGAAKKNWSMPKKNSFRVIENEWIVMKDGVRLGARLWIPIAAD